MALIGEMHYLTIGGNTYAIPISGGSTVSITRSLTSGTKTATISVDGTSYDLYAPTPNAGTVTKVTAGTGLSIGTTAGGNFTTSGTINHTNSVTAQTTQAVYPIKIDAQGHISAYGTAVTSMPASDVSAWAKASTKPSYNFSEIGSKPTTLSGYGITDAYTKTQVDGLVAGVLHYKGTKATVSALPTSGNTTGDVWHITADGSEWAWDGSAWQELGTAIDLSGYAQLSGASFTGPVTFGDSVTADELETGDLVVTGASSFTNNISANTINGVTVGNSPKFTDTTYSSLTAASGGTAVSLVTTGEKYTWNNKQDKLTNPVTGTGTNGYLAKWNGTGSITNGPQLGSTTTTYLNNAGSWATPPGTATGHTHSLSIAASTGTSSISLVANTKYQLSAGNNTYIFTTPPVPTKTSDLTNDGDGTSAFATMADIGSFGGGTVTSVGVANATNGGLSISGSPVTTSGTITIGHSNVLSSAQTTQAVYPIKIDKNGHISAYGSAVTIPTKVSDLTNDSGFITTDEKVKRTTYTSTNPLYPILHTDKTGTSTAYTSDINFYQYYNTAGGYRRLNLGNSTAYKSTGGAYGTIRLYGSAATYYGDLVPGVLGTTSGDGHISANRTWTLPDKTGTIALTSDIVSLSNYTDGSNVSYYIPFTNLTGSNHTLTSAMVSPNFKVVDSQMANVTSLYLGNDLDTSQTTYRSGILRLYSQTGNYTELAAKTDAAYNRTVYLPNSSDNPIILASTNDIPTITLNGSSTTSASFYAPTSAGTNGYVLKSNGSGAPSWGSAILTDKKLEVAEVTTNTIYYPIVGTGASASTRQYDTTGFKYSSVTGTSSTMGYARITLGNSTPSGTAGNKVGQIQIYGRNNNHITFEMTDVETSTNCYLPNKTGTIALTSDIPDDNYFLNLVYPVGAIYISTVSTSPENLFGGTWVQIQDTFLLAAGSTYAAGATGGEATHTLTAAESGVPAHGHGFTQPTVTIGTHQHTPYTGSTTDEYFVTSADTSANNTRVTYSSSGNRWVDGMTAQSTFHHRVATTAADLGTKTATGGAVQNNTAANATNAHNNMPPYLAVYVWKRTA